MASSPKPDATKEIIGMTLPGIEDYTNDFDEDSDSSQMDMSRSNKQGMIRNSFQVLLPIGSPNQSVKSTLPISTNNDNDNDNDSEYEIDPREMAYGLKIEEEEDDDIDPILLEAVKQQIKDQKNKEKTQMDENNKTKKVNLPNNATNLHKKQHSVLELDESDTDTITTTDEEGTTDSETDTSTDSDSDSGDNNSSKSSSPWGTDPEEFDEGVMTYWVLDHKPDPNATKFAMTPFESVVDEASSKLKHKFDKITYPQGSKFHSKDLLDTQDYHRLQNVQFVKWIKSDIYNTDHIMNNNECKQDEKNGADCKENPMANKKGLSLSMKSGEDIFVWLKKGINEVYTYYRGRDGRDLKDCFNLLDAIFEHFAGDNYKLMLRHEQRDDYQLFKLFELLLHTFARLSCRLSSNPNVQHSFYRYLDHSKKIFPKFRAHLELLKENHKAHIDKDNATHCMRSFVQIYHKNQHTDYETAADIPSFELSVKALVALDLYMENYSPLNHSILSDKAAYDINCGQFNWLDGYNKYNKYASATESDDEEEEDMQYDHNNNSQLVDDNLHRLTIELCSSPQSRITKLIAKYQQFRGFSFLRARVSWVIGHSKLYHQRTFYESEKYFFEALYCLKTLPKYEFFPLNSTMHTELASLILIDYADVLLENKKYQYAIVALEKVIDCLEQRGKYERRFQIIRKLCITCTEKEDWARAIKYHNITLRKLKDNYLNLNEFVYLSQQISTIHLKKNNFNQSEKEIQNGIKTIYLNVLSYHNDGAVNNKHIARIIQNINNITIEKIFEHCEGEERISIGSLILVLANLYISGGNYLDHAISLLEYLKKKVFTGNAEARRLLILFQLARAYFKNGRYRAADEIIEKRILSNYSSKNKELLTSLEFIQLRVLIMINCKEDNKFQTALRLLDDAMKHERKESFVKKAKINYLKGRVLQARCFDKLIKKYEQHKQRVRFEKKRQSAKQSAKIVITKPISIQIDNNNNIENKENKEEEYKEEYKDEYKVDIDVTVSVNSGSTLFDAANTIYSHTPTTPAVKPKHRRGGHGGGGVVDFSDAGSISSNKKDINPLDAISALLVSHGSYKNIDPIMQAKCCLELSKTYLEIIMEYYALPTFVLKDTKCSDPILKWLGIKIFNNDNTPNGEVITHCLDEIYRPLYTALTLSKSETKDIGLLIESYIALAEFEFLKGANTDIQMNNNNDNDNNNNKSNETSSQTSKNFWQQSKIAFFSTYRDSDDWIFLRRIDRHSRLQIFTLFKRILRLLICYDNAFIADNVEIFVSYISLETFMIAQQDIIVNNKPNKLNKRAQHRNNLSNQFEKQKIPQNQYQKSKLKSKSKSKAKSNNNSNKGTDFSRYNSSAIYRSTSVKQKQRETNNKHKKQRDAYNNYINNTEEEKGEIIKNPTVTFRIDDEQNEGLSQNQLSADISAVRPLYQRYADYMNSSNNKKDKKNCVGGEKYLDELFRMHWKMRTESNMFSGGRSTDIDNDKSLVQITKCISALNVELDINCTLNRKHRCWKTNETFLIALDSIVFIFHPHTLFKHGINKKRNAKPMYSQLKSFANILTNIAFHDADYLRLDENPWINRQNNKVSFQNLFDYTDKKMVSEKKEEKKTEEERIKHNDSIRMRLASKNKKHDHELSDKQQLLLTNELSLPNLKLESVKELLMCLDPQNILNLLGAMFSECQIIIVSKERCRCLAIMDALFVLMYPFAWQYPCISWLSPYCFELLDLPIPYIFGVANIQSFNDIIFYNKYGICDRAVIIDADTNNVMKPLNIDLKPNQLPMKIKSKLTRAMFRLMSGLLKNAFQINTQKHWVFPPRRRDNMNTMNDNYPYQIISHAKDINRYKLLKSPRTGPISICSERKIWYKKKSDDNQNDELTKMIIDFQNEFATAWVEVIEQYRLFWVHINNAHYNKDVKSKSTARIQKYAHPRYRKFLTEIQKTRMFSSFQCIRSLANGDMLKLPLFDMLVMQSLKWRMSLYNDIIQQEQQESQMRVSVENSRKRYFINHLCTVKFDPKACTLFIKPDTNINPNNRNLFPFEVYLKATDYELESDHVHKLHPYIDPKQVKKYGERYQFVIKHQKDGTLTLNCKSYYQLTRWTHILRAHSMDTWSWFLKFNL